LCIAFKSIRGRTSRQGPTRDAAASPGLSVRMRIAFSAVGGIALAGKDFVTVHGDCPDFRGEVRENGTVPVGRSGGGRIIRRETARKTRKSPAYERLQDFVEHLAPFPGLAAERPRRTIGVRAEPVAVRGAAAGGILQHLLCAWVSWRVSGETNRGIQFLVAR